MFYIITNTVKFWLWGISYRLKLHCLECTVAKTTRSSCGVQSTLLKMPRLVGPKLKLIALYIIPNQVKLWLRGISYRLTLHCLECRVTRSTRNICDVQSTLLKMPKLVNLELELITFYIVTNSQSLTLRH